MLTDLNVIDQCLWPEEMEQCWYEWQMIAYCSVNHHIAYIIKFSICQDNYTMQVQVLTISNPITDLLHFRSFPVILPTRFVYYKAWIQIKSSEVVSKVSFINCFEI